MKHLVFDSWAILSYLQNEKASKEVEDIISDALEKSHTLLVHSINLGEIWYILARKLGASSADSIIKTILDIGFTVVDTNWVLTRKAAEFKLGGGISYADCFSAATAYLYNASLITGDLEFKRVANDIDIVWLER